MNTEQEKRILLWVSATARDEYLRINHILNWLKQGEIKRHDLFTGICKEQADGMPVPQNENLSVEDRIMELLAYQYELKRCLNKIKRRMDGQENIWYETETVGLEISSDMAARAEDIKYQIHENRQAGIFAWELAGELVDMQEELIKKYQIPWEI